LGGTRADGGNAGCGRAAQLAPGPAVASITLAGRAGPGANRGQSSRPPPRWLSGCQVS